MKQVAIFTSFADIQKAYSLNIVVQQQIKMLLLNGYKPTIIVHESFQPEGLYAHPNVKIFKVPNMPVHNEVKKDETFDADVDVLTSHLKDILKDVDVVLTHDVVYQAACLKHNFAARRVAKELPTIKWLHWIHSATSPELLNLVRPIFSDAYIALLATPFPNSKYVYPNSYAVPAVAKNFNVSPEDIRVVPHATDIGSFFGMTSEVEQMVHLNSILEADAVTTYPVRLDRGKQVEHVIKTMAALKKFGLSIRIIIVDFHSTGGDKIQYRDELKELAIDLGLNAHELLFTSEQEKEWQYEVDPRVVGMLQSISNVFIMPSVSETYSLVTQEAALTRQVVVLNYDFPPFRSIYGPNAIYRKYSSRFDMMADPKEAVSQESQTNTEYGSKDLPPEARKAAEWNYHLDTAGQIAGRLQHPEMALATFLRKERNLQTVFKKHLEILFYE